MFGMLVNTAVDGHAYMPVICTLQKVRTLLSRVKVAVVFE